MITVFDEARKTDTARKKRHESLYSYLSRSANPDSTAGRRLIEEWFSRFPADEQTNLRSRFQSGRDKDFHSAFQELFLYELVMRLGGKLTIHKRLAETEKLIDFEVLQPDGTEFRLEAVSSAAALSGHDNSPRGIEASDFLDCFILDGYSLGIDQLVAGTENLQQTLLATHIRGGLQKTAAGDAGRVSVPLFKTEDGWGIKVTAIPNDSNWSATDGRINYVALSRTRSDPSRQLLAALKKKGTRYGKQGIPYVIAVNNLEPFLDESAFDDALFGQRPQTPMPDTTTMNRGSGFWGTTKAQSISE
jgi:hypothetical protein